MHMHVIEDTTFAQERKKDNKNKERKDYLGLNSLTEGFLSFLCECGVFNYMHMCTHTPGHPSIAEEAWYWLTHILHIG